MKFDRSVNRNRIKIDVRVVAATAKDLKEEVRRGAFRQDLYYRLDVLTINLPPLNQRSEDIPLLCRHFINRLNGILDKNIKSVAPEAMSRLLDYHWPGNVRELENVLERAMIIADGDHLLPEHFSLESRQPDRHAKVYPISDGLSLKHAQKVLEKDFITRALQQTGGNRTQAARLLEISHPSLLSKMKAYEIDL